MERIPQHCDRGNDDEGEKMLVIKNEWNTAVLFEWVLVYKRATHSWYQRNSVADVGVTSPTRTSHQIVSARFGNCNTLSPPEKCSVAKQMVDVH
jgi:hypothetical protein